MYSSNSLKHAHEALCSALLLNTVPSLEIKY